MATVTVLKSVKPKKERDRVVLLETRPRPEWFVGTTEAGRRVWYLRFQVTGILPRFYGPFKNRRTALLFLDAAHDALADAWVGIDEACEARMLERQFQKVWPPLVEHPLVKKVKGMIKGDW